MNMKNILTFCCLILSISSFGQSYPDSLRAFRTNYINDHGVVKGHAVANLQFFAIDENYKVVAVFEKKENSTWFTMKTSGTMDKIYRVYGTATFMLEGMEQKLNIYQSQDLLNTSYQDYLFMPFTDATNGNETYFSGRYIDLRMNDIKNESVVIDFNKAYNPYCAYVDGKYNCPIPPKENALMIAIKAGEKNFSK
jgi:uncharacterized protein